MNFKSTRMWPVLLDMTKEESMQCLRNLELEAYAHLVSALRAQGPLNPDKRKLLKDTSLVLNITQDRHKAEIRRAINDEKLNTIAYHVTGLNESIEDWAQEGRRTVPLIPRLAPQTVYSAIADDVADCANQNNKQLPPPALTERKRVCTSPQILPETTTNITSNNNNNNNNNSINNSSKTFRVSDLTTKVDESNRKRKLSSSSSLSPSPSSTIVNTESSLAQHLLHGPAMKMNRNEQIYRHRTKQMLKEQSKLRKYSINGPKLQNNEETIEQIQNEINNYTQQQQSNNNDNQVQQQQQQQRSKLINPIKATNLIFKPIINPVAISTNPGPSFNNNVDNQQQEICSNLTTTTVVVTTATTTITTTLPKRPSPLPQKLIVVSNPQTLQQTNSNILQKSVSLPLVKNLTMKNLEKFKIVTTTNQQQLNSNVVTNLNSLKHKVVTVKTNPMKKVIPLSQLLNSKGGIKVLPIGGKIIGKALTTPTTIVSSSSSSTTTTTTNPVYIVNTIKTNIQEIDTTNNNNNNNNNNSDKENGKSTVLGEILKASGVTNEDFDAQIEEFHIPNNRMNNNKEIIKSKIEANIDNKQREIDVENQTIIEEKSDLIVVHENTEIIEETPEITTSQDNMEITTTTTNSDGN